MKELKGKWCINITPLNQKEITHLIKCGAGYYINQTIFFNEQGIIGNNNYSWNMNMNNICSHVKYPEIYLSDLKQMLSMPTEAYYEIY
jgi:hypothetical protein